MVATGQTIIMVELFADGNGGGGGHETRGRAVATTASRREYVYTGDFRRNNFYSGVLGIKLHVAKLSKGTSKGRQTLEEIQLSLSWSPPPSPMPLSLPINRVLSYNTAKLSAGRVLCTRNNCCCCCMLLVVSCCHTHSLCAVGAALVARLLLARPQLDLQLPLQAIRFLARRAAHPSAWLLACATCTAAEQALQT